MTTYQDFLASKAIKPEDCGFDVEPHDFLFDFQRYVTKWAIRKGRAAVFAGCGLGKTPIQLSWSDLIHKHTNKNGLILAPLAVSEQTKREGDKFGIPVNICRTKHDVKQGINIANYEMLHHFDPDMFGFLVVDESGILKSYDGVYRKEITEFASRIPFRLACTATPAPNDLVEIINHAEFLGIMSEKEVKGLFFRLDGDAHSWKIKGHARNDFWKWLASWSVAVRKPSDLGYDDGKFILPQLKIFQHTAGGHISEGMLFPVEAHTLEDRRTARRESIEERIGICANLANSSKEPWLMWCGLNKESEALTNAIPDAVEVTGSDPHEKKAEAMLAFSAGQIRVLVTKPKIAGFGMNWQHCNNMAFVGLSDSFEEMYQATRRCWRFGQTKPVNVHLVVAETEGAVLENVRRKEREYSCMMEELVNHIGEFYEHFKDDDRYSGKVEVKKPAWLTGGIQ
jgi:hypothetical protein